MQISSGVDIFPEFRNQEMYMFVDKVLYQIACFVDIMQTCI